MLFASNTYKTKMIHREILKTKEYTSGIVNICYIFLLSSIFENFSMLGEFSTYMFGLLKAETKIFILPVSPVVKAQACD